MFNVCLSRSTYTRLVCAFNRSHTRLACAFHGILIHWVMIQRVTGTVTRLVFTLCWNTDTRLVCTLVRGTDTLLVFA